MNTLTIIGSQWGDEGKGKVTDYFGENAIKLPTRFRELIFERQGVKCNHDRDVVVEFITWLKDKFEPGIHGLPIDRRWHKSC